MVYIEPGADWWRGRQWRCRQCDQWFVLDDPYRVSDSRGTIITVWFRCPACGFRVQLGRRTLDREEPPPPE